jgi:hypothetical protein
MKPSDTVLVTAAAGGTGHFAVQLAKRMGCVLGWGAGGLCTVHASLSRSRRHTASGCFAFRQPNATSEDDSWALWSIRIAGSTEWGSLHRHAPGTRRGDDIAG